MRGKKYHLERQKILWDGSRQRMFWAICSDNLTHESEIN
jgi:hypothetical protein